MTELPASGPIILLDGEQGLLAVAPDSGAVTRFTPTPTADPAALLAGPRALFSGRLLGLSGQSYALPLPRGAFGAALSPDGRTLAYAVAGERGASAIRLVGLDGAEDRPLTDQGAEPSWLADGALGLRDGDTLGGGHVVRVRPDGADLTVLVDGGGARLHDLSFSPDGTRLLVVSSRAGDRPGESASSLLLGERGGPSTTFDAGSGGHVGQPRFSPDGARFGFLARLPSEGERRSPTNLYVAGADGAPRALLGLSAKKPSFLPWGGAYAGVVAWAWSPDGDAITFAAALSGDCRKNGDGALLCKHDLYVVRADGQDMRKVARLGLSAPPTLLWAR